MSTRLLESIVEKKVSKWATDHGIMNFKFEHAGNRGWPDRIFIRHGRCVLVEFKAEGLQPRQLQYYRIALLNEGRTPAIWTTDYEEAVEFLCKNFNLTHTK
jgi:hypothetical protein